MAPKRKATASVATEPPAKRVTRNSRHPASVDPEPAAPPKPARGARRSKATEVTQEVHEEEKDKNSDVEATVHVTRATRRGRGAKTQPVRTRKVDPLAGEAGPAAPRKRGRLPTKKAEKTKNPSPEVLVASTSKVTIENLQETAEVEESDDELLLIPEKKTPSPRPRTPPKNLRAASIHGTPRMVLDAVEVPTPSKRMRDILNIGRSPRVVSPGKVTTPSAKLLPPRETTPTRSIPRPTAKKSSPRRVARPRSPSPEVDPDEEPAHGFARPATSVEEYLPSPTKPAQKEKAARSRQLRALPAELEPCLEAQKKVALQALHQISVTPQTPEGEDGAQLSTNVLAYEQLRNLFKGTIERGEGNSCLVVGPKGSGKTQLVERAISSLPQSLIVIRLSGHAQTNDRLAIREIAWQLAEQTGHSLLPADDAAADDENPFIEGKPDAETVVTLPPPSHLLALIAMLPTLARPTVLVLDAFDLFALHARQSLLYCLLDTVQSCRAVTGSKGIAVVGVTTRVETINILEKRVKSRFSGRILRMAGHPRFEGWVQAAREALCARAEVDEVGWGERWGEAVQGFLEDEQVLGLLKETYSLTKDVRVLSRLLVSTIVALKPASPYPTASDLTAAVAKQRAPPRFSFLTSLTYPAICLLIAAAHARTSGHENFTFEMLHESFREQVRGSLSAPITVDGGGIGMVRCSREVLFVAFEKLVALKVFVAAAPGAVGTGREFIKYRCDVDRAEIKSAVETLGQLNLKKWLNKAS